jgi:hypothetical protein
MSKIYLPISKGPYLKKEGNWVRENPLCDLTFDELLKDLIDGQYGDEIVSIIEIDLAAGTSKEAIDEFADAVYHKVVADWRPVGADLAEWLADRGFNVSQSGGER